MMYGFLDEAGDVGTGQRASRILVMAVVVTVDPKPLRREVKKFRARLGKKRHQIPEFKASQSLRSWNRRRLERLAKLDIEIVVIVGNKAVAAQRKESEELYRSLCAHATEECLHRYSSLI